MLGIVIGVCVMLFLMSAGAGHVLMLVGAGISAIGVILLVVYFVKRSRYKSDSDLYYSLHSQWENTSEKEAEELRKKAEKIVNSN